MTSERYQATIAEFLGTAFLLAAIVGSGIMGERLAAGNSAIALLANSLATGAMLVVLILTFGEISGAHFNPVVTLVFALEKSMPPGELLRYLGAQVAGAVAGVATANIMFGLAPFTLSQHARAGGAQMFSEFIATFGLVTVILACARFRPEAIAYAVAGYITAAYWFTASTSFANPVVTLARALTDTFSGIRPVDVPGFVVAQALGGTSALGVFRWMVKRPAAASEQHKREVLSRKGTA